jgi:hypothetical protein
MYSQCKPAVGTAGSCSRWMLLVPTRCSRRWLMWCGKCVQAVHAELQLRLDAQLMRPSQLGTVDISARAAAGA